MLRCSKYIPWHTRIMRDVTREFNRKANKGI